MAVLARAMVTLASIKDVASTTRYYKLLSSTATAPSAPTTNPPDNTWSTTEPTYSETSTNTLYFVDLTVFSDGDFAYSEVSKSTSYEAAKSAYNVAQNAKDVADSAQESIDNLKVGGRNLLLDTGTPHSSRSGAEQYIQDYIVSDYGKLFFNNTETEFTLSFDYEIHGDYSSASSTSRMYAMINATSCNPANAIYMKDAPRTGHYVTTCKMTAAQVAAGNGTCRVRWNGIVSGCTYTITNYKLEMGNVETDWTPAPEDITNSIDGISIGGRNLLLDSEKEVESPAYENSTVYTPYYYVSDYGKPYVSEEGIIFTLSAEFEVVGDDSGGSCGFYGQCNNQAIQNISNYGTVCNEYVTSNPYTGIYKRTFALTSTQATNVDKRVRFGLFLATAGTTIKVKHVKLELGNRATDWTPAPEDIDNDIINSIDNISIGGRNLLLNSSFTKDYNKWTVSQHEIVTQDGIKCGHVSGSFSTAKDMYQDIFDQIKDDDYLSQTYVVSADVKLVDYTNGSTNPFLALYFSGHYDNNGSSSWLGATYTGGNLTDGDLRLLNNQGWKHVYCIVRFNKKPTTMGFHIYGRDFEGDLYYKNVKLERGNKGTNWTPAPEDFEESVATVSNTLTDYINSTEIIVGTQTAATGSWTGVAGFSELRDGQQIAYWLPYAGSGSASLNLTLSDGTTTGAITVYYKGSTVATTHFTAGTVIHLTYRVNANVNGTAYTGWWADASYDSGNTYNRIRFENAILAKSAISASRFIVGDDSGFSHLVGGSVFDITKPILWATSAIQSGKTATTNYLAINGATLRNNSTGITLTQYQTCYLVGTLSGRMFTTNLTNFFTSTIPTSDDGYYYIALGYLYSTYQIYLYPEHPIYKFVDGEFKNLNQVAYEASVLASEAKDDIENLEVGGTNLILDGNFTRDFEEWTSNQYQSGATLPVIAIEDGKKCCHYQGTVGKYAQRRQNIFNNIANDEAGQRYTVSFDFKLVNYVGGSTNPYLKVYFTGNYDDNGTSKALYAVYDKEDPDLSIFNNQGWVRVVISNVYFNHKPTNMWFTIYSRDYSGDAYFTNVKLERGTKATDWSPAPEDIEYAMNNVSIESSADSFINYTFNGDRLYYPTSITLTPFINGNISFSKWQYRPINDTTWVDVSSGNHGITVYYDNELSIANSSDLFTDTCSAIIFKCVSDNESYSAFKTVAREDDPTRVYNTVKTRVDQTDTNLSLIASSTELAEYSTSSTLNTKLSNVSLSSDEILMVVSQSVNNTTGADGIKGVYSETTTYAKDNIVVLDGKFYKAKSASTGQTPPNATYWTDVSSNFSESVIKSAFSQIVALQDSITLTVSGASGSSSTLNLGDGTLSMSVTDVATILADKELNLTSTNGVININGNGGVNIGTSSKGAITINSPNFSLDKDGNIISVSGSIGGWDISSQDLVKHTIELRGENGGYYIGIYNPWKIGRTYFVGDIVSVGLSVTNIGNITYTNYICTQQHKAQDFQTQSNYWKFDSIWTHQVPRPIDYTVYNMDFNSYNCSISIFEENYNISTEVDTTKSVVLSVDGLSISSSSNSVPTELRSDGLYHDIGYGEDLSKLYIYSSGYLELEGIQGIKLGAFTVGTNTGLLSIGDGTITGAISTLNSSKSNLITTRFYRTNDNSISASSYKDITYNIALSGYTAIGLVGARVEGNSSVALFGFYLGTSDNTAYARVKNLTSSSQTGVKVGFTVLYVKD